MVPLSMRRVLGAGAAKGPGSFKVLQNPAAFRYREVPGRAPLVARRPGLGYP